MKHYQLTVLCGLTSLLSSASEIATGSRFVTLDAGAPAKAQTTFVLSSEGPEVKMRVDCESADREKFGNWSVGSADTVEVFLAPEGTVQNYYQFCVNSDGVKHANFYSEKGMIQPDPYDPEWSVSIATNATGWSCELSIPLEAFYMTRTANWKTDWLVNVTRNDWTGGGLSSWAHCLRSFHEPDVFKRVSGFPVRKADRDAYLEMATMQVEKLEAGQYKGMLRVRAMAAVAGDYVIVAEGVGASQPRHLRADQFVKVDFPAAYASTGRQRTRIILKRLSDGREFIRHYPVRVDYEPLKYRLTQPEYRDNFYPGQDASRVSGTVWSLAGGDVSLTLEGPGIAKTVKTVPSGVPFEFATPGFEIGTARLSIVSDGHEKTVKIRRLAPSGHMMTWVSGGNLIVNGEPTFRRDFYAPMFGASAAWADVYTNDVANGMHLTRDICRGGWLEPMRLMGGRAFEAKEVKKDIYPCREYLEKVDRIIESLKDKEFGYYYISDEPDVRGLSEVYLKHIYEYVKERDPYHVILTATRTPARYVDCADWFETHPYLDPHVDATGKRLYQHEMKAFGPYFDQLTGLNRSDKCIGFVPTAFTYGFLSSFADYPTFDEYVCHVMTALAHGAKTLWPFSGGSAMSRPGMFEAIRWTFAFTHTYEDILLRGTRELSHHVAGREKCVWILGDERLTIDLNFNAPFDVAYSYEGPRPRTLEPLASAQARAAELEAQRTDPRSLLVGRQDEIVMTFSGNDNNGLGNLKSELVDGVRLTKAWSAPSKGEKFVEMSFPSFTPVFNRVRVSGEGLEDLVVKVWKNRAWVVLDGAVTLEKYARSITLRQPMKTIRMRFEFPSPKSTHLYEIELLADEAPVLTKVEKKLPAFVRQWGISNMAEKVVFDYDPAKSWFVAKLDKAVWEEHPTWQYHSWHVKVWPGVGVVASGGRSVLPGVYMAKLPENPSAYGKQKKVSAEVCGLNYTLKFAEFGCVPPPPNRVEVNTFGKATLTVGDEIEVIFTLADPAEDVTCSLIGNTINGSTAIALDPVDDTGTLWRGRVKIESVAQHQKRPNETKVQVGALGGTLTDTLITPIQARFE